MLQFAQKVVHFFVYELLFVKFKTAKTRLVLNVRDSPDELISGAGIVTRAGRKWSATESVSEAERALKHRDSVGITAVGRQGIGATKTVLWSRSDQKERRTMIQSEVMGFDKGHPGIVLVHKRTGTDSGVADLCNKRNDNRFPLPL